MGRLLENQSKALLRDLGVAVPPGRAVATPDEAATAARELGRPVVLKALVPVGKRGKAGAVKFATTPEEAAARAAELFAMKVAHYRVDQVLVEEKLAIAQELYLSIAIDKSTKQPVVIASAEGGIEVEEVARRHPEKVSRTPVDPLTGLAEFKARELWADLGLHGKALLGAGAITHKLFKAFTRFDAYLMEINPLVITAEGSVQAAAVVMAVDDAALYRHPELAALVQLGSERAWRPLTELEKAMVAVNEADPYRGTARYTEMDGGDIGFMCGGGGGSLMLFDAIVAAGGQPANYSEFGGNPPEEKCYGLAKGILTKPGVKGLIVAQNITNNSQTDVQGRGIVRALQELGIDPQRFPVVVRQAGVNEAEAKKVYEAAGVEYHGDDITLTQAAELIVAKMQAAYGAATPGGEGGRA